MNILIASINFTEIIKAFQIIDWSLCINKQQESSIVNYLSLFFSNISVSSAIPEASYNLQIK